MGPTFSYILLWISVSQAFPGDGPALVPHLLQVVVFFERQPLIIMIIIIIPIETLTIGVSAQANQLLDRLLPAPLYQPPRFLLLVVALFIMIFNRSFFIMFFCRNCLIIIMMMRRNGTFELSL